MIDGGWEQKKNCGALLPKQCTSFKLWIKKEFLNPYNWDKVLERNHLKVDLILDDIREAEF